MADPKPPRPRKRDMVLYEQLIFENVLAPFLERLRMVLMDVGDVATMIFRLEHEIRRLKLAWDTWMEEMQGPLGGLLRQVAETHLNDLQAAYRAALGIDIAPLLSEPPVKAFMDAKLQENIDLIQNIPDVVRQKLFGSLQTLVREHAFDEKKAAQAIHDAGYRGRMQLRLIARDQISKSVGGLQQIRQTQLGLKKYRWLSSGDERVRPSHRANEGLAFEWSVPPRATGHPGQDILCRCRAQPILSEYDRERIKGQLS